MGATAEKRIGESIGRYRLLGEVARGGMATVHFAQLAAAHGFEKWVAVKLMHEHISQDQTFVSMFLDEARIVSQLNHPNICQVLDFGDDSDRLFLVMEYMHGETLASIVRNTWKAGKRVPLWFAARTIADVARGLHAAHELKDRTGKPVGLVHRDVSPQNVMVLYDGVSKLMDFGVVRAEGRLTETQAGTLKGKFAYMAPEQLRGADSDKRADIWALGVMLWELACGKRLFRAKGEGETAVMVIQGDIPDPRSRIEGFPDALADVIMGCLTRNPEQRTATARDVAVGLERYLLEAGKLASPEDVGAYLEERFPGRNAARYAELQRRQEEGVAAETYGEDPSTQSRVRSASGLSEAVPTGFLPRRGLLVALLLLIAAAGGSAAVFLARGPAEEVGEEGPRFEQVTPPAAAQPVLTQEDPAPDPSEATGDTRAAEAETTEPEAAEPEDGEPPEAEPDEHPEAEPEARSATRRSSMRTRRPRMRAESRNTPAAMTEPVAMMATS
ncbi:MAG: protein kinase, partial [Myxococcota bacterium]